MLLLLFTHENLTATLRSGNLNYGRACFSLTELMLASLCSRLVAACRLWRLGDIMLQRYKEGSEIQNKNMFFLIISLSIN